MLPHFCRQTILIRATKLNITSCIYCILVVALKLAFTSRKVTSVEERGGAVGFTDYDNYEAMLKFFLS